MNAIVFPYSDLTSEALVKIFQLADLLKLTPAVATKLYLKYAAAAELAKAKPAA